MSDFVEAAQLEQVPEGKGRTCTVAERDIALFNVGGTIYAIDDACIHKGASLGSGELAGNVVTCRAHGWKFDVTSGSTLASPGYGVCSYPVRIEDGKVFVDVKAGKSPE